jgi:diaminohydroxyphosphoribosylaminopyrimidine deaminase/5-amino-6-(5-phosphoribosylamino)uracil reductase
MEEDEKYMWRCIQLAKNGKATASPNPMVGAVIVCDGKIIGEGYHIRCGDWHAEVNAVRSVKDPSLLKRSTLYVSLEPCSHYGKTPPCADMIIEKGIPRIVIGCRDPFAKVDGRGIQKLREAGREVVTDVLSDECRQLNSSFMTYNTLHRPHVTLKWAESADGFIASTSGKTMISTPYSLTLAHKRRAESDAIMVGTTTAEVDNPRLDTRFWFGRSPLRIVLDRSLRLPSHLHLFDGSTPTLVYTTGSHVSKENVEYVVLPTSKFDLPHILDDLYSRNIHSLLVEGGARLHTSLIDSGLWDEAFVEKSTVILGGGVEAATLRHVLLQEENRIFGTKFMHFIRL